MNAPWFEMKRNIPQRKKKEGSHITRDIDLGEADPPAYEGPHSRFSGVWFCGDTLDAIKVSEKKHEQKIGPEP